MLTVAAAVCLLMQSVQAQSYDDVGSRLANIEKRLNALDTRGGANGTANSGDIELRMQDLETENSQVNGNVERLSNSVQQLSKKLDEIVKDLDMRLQDLENRQPAAAAAPAASAADAETGDVSEVTVKTDKASTAKVPDNLSATEHYNKAYGFLTAADYPNAEKWLGSFIQKFPKDKLGDNAYYWLGEVYLVENKPTEAVKAFKGGLTAFPQGAKAPANYLKMGVALQQLKKPEMAKVVWEKLVKEHPRSAEAVKAKDYLLELKNGGKASKT